MALSPFIDGHVDILYEMMRRRMGIPFARLFDGPVTPDKLAAGNIRIIVAAFYCPDLHNGPEKSAAFLNSLFEYADRTFGHLKRIDTKENLASCLEDNEGPGVIRLIENADALLDLDLEEVKRRGVKTVGLTHAGQNRIGDGNGVETPQGLTREGKRLVRELARLGFVVDAAHLSDPSFEDLVDIYDGPIVSSHTGFRFFCNRTRNLRKEQLDLLFERKGVVGIGFDPAMLSDSGKAGIEDVFRHIDWAVQRYGPDFTGIGSDLCGFDETNAGLEDASRFPDLARLLLDRGYPQDAVSTIMGGAWRRFYSSVL